MNDHFRKYLFFTLILLFILMGCSTEKNTWVNRTFHDINARYNGYYHAYKNLDDGFFQLAENHQEDLDELIAVYPMGKDRKSIYPLMDNAITKATTVIGKHSMIFKIKREEQEVNKWVDDAYMVIGQAHFLKEEYKEAHDIFKYVEENFDHLPTKYDAFMWDIRVYLDEENYNEAYRLITNLEEDTEFPQEKKGDFEVIKAKYHIEQVEFYEAREALLRALPLTKKKDSRIRYTYLLAQISDLLGEQDAAVRYYEQVVKLNPPYEYAFKSKINMALSYSGGNPNIIRKNLLKMVKDDKNKEFLDEIYYALAELELKQENLNQAEEYLILSTRNSLNNQEQKGKSYLKLADINFSKPDYFNAQAYYDSCVKVINPNFPDYDNLVEKRNSLNELVDNYRIIQTEDSLQRIANMSESDRQALIAGLIEDYIVEQERLRDEQETETLLAMNNNGSLNDNQNAGGWYFANPSSISMGRSEFTRIYGSRPLEDNWRRSNKSSSGGFDGPSLAGGVPAEDEYVDFSQDEAAQPEYYLKGLPLSDSAMSVSMDNMINAYFKMGMVYLEGLYDLPKAAETFEEMMKRSTDHVYAAQVYYTLYRVYRQIDQPGLSNQNSSIVLNQFPDSDYAKLIINPNYGEEQAAQERQAELTYQNLYRVYLSGNYAQVISEAENAKTTYKQTKAIPKFEFIQLLAKGHNLEMEDFKEELSALSKKYNDHPIQVDIDSVIKRIQSAKENDKQKEFKQMEKESPFKLNKLDPHQMVVMLETNKANVNDFTTSMANFNSQYFSTLQLHVKSIVWNNDYTMIIITGIPTIDKGKQYYETLRSEPIMDEVKTNGWNHFLISQPNFRLLMQNRLLEEYMQFFFKGYGV